MAMPGNPSKKYHCAFEETGEQVHGPFDFMEMASLLRGNHVTGDTLVFVEGEEQWMPFKERPDYHLAREVSAEAIAQHTKEHTESQESNFSWRRMKLLVWALPVLFLVIGWRVVVFVIRMEEKAVAPSAEVTPSDSSTTTTPTDSTTPAPPPPAQ